LLHLGNIITHLRCDLILFSLRIAAGRKNFTSGGHFFTAKGRDGNLLA